MTKPGAQALVKELDSAGDLPAGFGPLLESVPREWFIPDRIWVNRKPISRAAEPERWLAAVYGNQSVVTQFDDGWTLWPEVGAIPTCSASAPSVVVGMLDALDVKPGDRVLELGTGTGYNAALLSKLVGDEGHVVTVEIDSALAEEAGRRLESRDFGAPRVRLVVDDAARGVEYAAPFDRVIATMSVHLGRVPYSWVAQTKPGGKIVVPVRADLASGPLVEFTVNEDGTATGRTLPMGVGFMESRSQRTAEAPDDGLDLESGYADKRVTTIDPAKLLEVPSPRWALAVALGSCQYDIEEATPARPHKLTWLRDPLTDSWASVTPMDSPGEYRVRQRGVRRLWDEAEAAYLWWVEKGQPFITAWEWLITPDRQSIKINEGAGVT
ncbi:methyltransferase domain-containing protein [Amycolatopsis sacchari]|uniref:methyltransferase domain-containing protein n=1 Tax=Amycolatopsis sacchari TaxID=115433 RepID=UPI003D728C70